MCLPYISPIEHLWTKSLFKICSWWRVHLCFSSLFAKYPNIDGNDEKLSRFFLEFSFVSATQTNSKSGEDVSQIIEPEWFVEKSAVKTDIKEEKRPQIGLCRKISNLYKVSSVFNVCLSFTKPVNYKVSSTAKNYVLLLSPNNPTAAGKISLAITRQITQEDINF